MNSCLLMFSLSEDGNSIQLKWKNDDLDTHHGGVVLIDGNIYGSNWQNNANGKWVSVNWENGKTNWETKWENKQTSAQLALLGWELVIIQMADSEIWYTHFDLFHNMTSLCANLPRSRLLRPFSFG